MNLRRTFIPDPLEGSAILSETKSYASVTHRNSVNGKVDMRRLPSDERKRSLPMTNMFRALFLVSIALLSTAATSSAGNWITATKCDTTSTAGVTYPIIDFEVTNLYPDPKYPICMILLIPKTPATVADTCRAIAAFGKPGWDRDADPNGRVIWIQNASDLDCIWPGSTGSGFRLVLSRAHSCCYKVEFYGALFEPFAVSDICFDCDLPTGAQRSTWGHVKAVYR